MNKELDSEFRSTSMDDEQRSTFRSALTDLLGRYHRESGSDTPDFILAAFLARCLDNFDLTTRARKGWYGRSGNPKDL